MPHASATIGVLFSGGLDSAILVAKLLAEGQSVQPVYVRSGLVWESAELPAAQRFLDAIRTPKLHSLVMLDLPMQDTYGEHWSVTGMGVPDAQSPDEAVFLPGRNALLLSKAAVWCQLHSIPELALATLGTSPFPDASPDFIQHFEIAINLGADRMVRVRQPFAGMTKRDVMRAGRTFPLHLTYSCIAPVNGASCGRCNKCAERQQAFGYLSEPLGTAIPTESQTKTAK